MGIQFTSTSTRRFAVRAAGLGAAVLCALLIATGARANEDPADFVRHLGDRATAIFGDGDLSADMQRQAFRGVLRTHFDLDRISRAVLGRHWRRASDQERAAYRRVFEDYLVATNTRRLKGYAGERFRVGDARDTGAKGTFVASEFVRPKQPPVRLVWRLMPAEGSWRVVDILIEGVSMVVTHRAEFQAAIRQSGGRIEGLLDRLRTVIARLAAAPQQHAHATVQ